MYELKFCPFCGEEAMTTESETYAGDFENCKCLHFGVSCSEPNCIGYDVVPRYRTLKEAVDAWNSRSEERLKKVKLKPCPFCGTKQGEGLWRYDKRRDYYHFKNGCFLGGTDIKESDFDSWNYRREEEDSE